MEKRNFVTPLRVVEGADDADQTIEKIAERFGGQIPYDITPGVLTDPDFVKRASAEDAKTDSLA